MSEQSNIRPLRSFDETVKLLNRKLDNLNLHEKKTVDFQIEIGRVLLELRDRIEAGEIGDQAVFHLWFKDNVRQISLSAAYLYMQFANDPDPHKALAEFRAKRTAEWRATRNMSSSNSKTTDEGNFSNSWKSSNAAHDYTSSPGSSSKSKQSTEDAEKVTAEPRPQFTVEQMEQIERFTEMFRAMDDDIRVLAFAKVNEIYLRWRSGEE